MVFLEYLSSFLSCVFLICGIFFVFKAFKEAKRNEYWERQNNLLSEINNKLTGIDCRLIEIQENKGFRNDK